MVTANKYKAKSVFYDWQSDTVLSTEEISAYRKHGKLNLPFWIHRFDSQHEFRIFNKLKDMYGKNRIQLQLPILLYDRTTCHPNGKYWKIDFTVTASNNPLQALFYVEAKGVVNKEFEYILSALEQNNPKVFSKLYLVFPDRIPSSNRVIKNLLKTPFQERIYKRTQFNQLAKLI